MGTLLLLLHCHPSQKQVGRFKSPVKAARIYIPHQKKAIRQWIQHVLSCCLLCSFSSCHWQTQPHWFCQQLQKCWQSPTISCNQGTSRGHKTLWPNGCLCWGCFWSSKIVLCSEGSKYYLVGSRYVFPIATPSWGPQYCTLSSHRWGWQGKPHSLQPAMWNQNEALLLSFLPLVPSMDILRIHQDVVKADGQFSLGIKKASLCSLVGSNTIKNIKSYWNTIYMPKAKHMTLQTCSEIEGWFCLYDNQSARGGPLWEDMHLVNLSMQLSSESQVFHQILTASFYNFWKYFQKWDKKKPQTKTFSSA